MNTDCEAPSESPGGPIYSKTGAGIDPYRKTPAGPLGGMGRSAGGRGDREVAGTVYGD